MKGRASILSDFLAELEVPHTTGASDAAFDSMNFKSLFGFTRLLGSYGIESVVYRLADNSAVTSIPTPFLAQTKRGFVIVTGHEDGHVDYKFLGKDYTVPASDLTDSMTGVVLLAYPDEKSKEPDYGKHRFLEIASRVKLWVLVLCAVALGVFGFMEAGLWRNVSTIFLTAVNLAGIGVTWLLILKSLKVSSNSADKICGILKEHGCDTVLEQKASKFFGLFGWSEVGFTYFTLSTLYLFLFPQYIGCLALINGCCLPFTVWSIWYQRFRLHTWCTLCVITQCLLWLQFFCFLSGGWWSVAFANIVPLVAMGAGYVGVLLALNRVMTFIENRIKN
ncbi:MAG: vitamin K epoxide reductase family protein [Paramuribaculum sp.]|nr:vitamin K epoxide reductase family protein [Paramuribaculum sp.]